MNRSQRSWPTMHPSIQGEVAKGRIADLHRQAERDRTARATKPVRKTHDRHFVPGQLATLLARRVLAMLAAHSPRAGSPPKPGAAPIEGGTP
jgi:hypothetical protein